LLCDPAAQIAQWEQVSWLPPNRTTFTANALRYPRFGFKVCLKTTLLGLISPVLAGKEANHADTPAIAAIGNALREHGPPGSSRTET
jgi:hypothetical protein